MQIDVFDMMKLQLDALGIQTLPLSAPYDNFPDFDYRFLKHTFINYDYSRLLDSLKKYAVSGTVLHFHEHHLVHYIFFTFPEELQENYEYDSCLIGPVLFETVNLARFQKFIDLFRIPPEHYQDAREFLNRIPVVPSSDFWLTSIFPFFKLLFGKSVEIQNADLCLTELILSDYNNYQLKMTSEASFQALEDRYRAENDFLTAVTNGNVEDSLKLYYKFCQFRLMPRVADQIRDQKDITITLNTLLRKAVQAASVHPYHIDGLSTQFAVQIENCTSLNQLTTLARTMVRKYCLLVKNYSRRGYSSLVQLSLDHIDTHYSQELSLDSLAKLCGVTNSYLSALFKKETDVNITDYIHTTRLRHALQLLNSTHMTVKDIALQCGYEDSNYFTRIFKKYQGLSPKEYRSSFS